MIKNKNVLLLALIFPIFVLMSLSAYKKYIYYFGEEIILPITGYDPRDLLSGHYISYNINYGVNNICPDSQESSQGYVCLSPKFFSYTAPQNCSQFIKGNCNYHMFRAGIEKFFIPENLASKLDKDVRNGDASIVISVTETGEAQVKDLLINGQSWK